MLSLAKVSCGHSAASYYENQDEYYHDDGRAQSSWEGTGAKRLYLSEEVDVKTFRELLDGQMPDGSQIHNASEGRRGGTDITLSAPKSISMQALIGNDQRLLDAHEHAVKSTLRYVESLASYRTTENGITHNEASDNMLFATFRHELSRANDPQIHTHSVQINATQKINGEWRALDQSTLYQQQKMIGALYRNILAQEVKGLGYEVRLTHNDGRFELAHITQKQIDGFSQRTSDIKSALAKIGKTLEDATPREKEVATLSTRESKSTLDRQELWHDWQNKSEALDVNYYPPLTAEKSTESEQLVAAEKALNYAVEHITERQAVAPQIKLIEAALSKGTGSTDLAAIHSAIKHQVRDGVLIQNGQYYTTPQAQAREKEMLDIELRNREAMKPIINENAAKQAISSSQLNAGQLAAAVHIVSTSSRVSAIQGSAGTGKTTLLKAAQSIIENKGYQIMGVAPSASAAKELSSKGIEGQTLARLAILDYKALNNKTVLIVDEASMVSAKAMHELLQAVEKADAKVVLVGDTQQLKAIESGRPFAQLQEAGMPNIKVGEIMRQNNAMLRDAVTLASQGNIKASMDLLKHQVNEINNSDERYACIAKDYINLPAKDQKETLILAGTHYARNAINTLVRSELGFKDKGVEVTTLERKDLTRVQARMSSSYQPGDIVQAMKNYQGLGLKRGDQALVVEAESGKIILERADGVLIKWQPAIQTNLSAYHVSEREFSVGDQIRITQNNHAIGVVNGDRATVTNVDTQENTMTLKTGDGREITLNTQDKQHLDHAYCTTIYSSQGQTVERVLMDADARSATAHESSYYVGISRAQDSITIYTNDKEALPDSMGRQDIKSAALDIEDKKEAALER